MTSRAALSLETSLSDIANTWFVVYQQLCPFHQASVMNIAPGLQNREQVKKD
jgi:hypothetical protein